MGKTPNFPHDHWTRTPWENIVGPARELFWDRAPGVHCVTRSDLQAHPDHGTLTLSGAFYGQPDCLIPFYTLSSATYVVPHKEATGAKIQATITEAMRTFCFHLERALDFHERTLREAFPDGLVKRQVFFLGSGIPLIKLIPEPKGIEITVTRELATFVRRLPLPLAARAEEDRVPGGPRVPGSVPERVDV